MNDSSVVAAAILDKEGLRHWQNRMLYLTTAKPEHGARMLRLDHAFRSPRGILPGSADRAAGKIVLLPSRAKPEKTAN